MTAIGTIMVIFMSEVPWKRAAKTKSQLQEQRLGKREDGQEQVNSGRSTWTSRRDNVIGSVYRFLVEARTTDKASYRIEAQEFRDLTKQATQTPPGLLPMIQLDLQELELGIYRLRDIDDMQRTIVDLQERVNGTSQAD